MIAIIVILSLLVVVWTAVFLQRGSLLAGCLAFLLIGYCFGRDLIGFQIGPLPMTIDRLVLGGLLIAYLVKRRLGHMDPKPITWVETAVLALAGVLTVSTLTDNWRLDVPGKVSPIWLLVAGYLMPIAVYWIVRQVRLTRRSVTWIYGFLGLFGLYLAVTAIAEVTQQWWLVFPKYMSDPSVGIHFGRARGPTLQSQSLGFYLVVCLLGAWFWRRQFGRAGQLALFLLYGLLLAAIVLTYTRCIWMGLALGGFLVLGLSLRGHWRPLVLGSLMAAGLAAAGLFWDDVVSIRRDSGAQAARSSVQQRASFTYVSWKMFQDRPILGAGFGQFPQAVKPYLADRSTSIPVENIKGYPHHNTFLALLTETGLVGLGLFVAILAGFARNAWRMWRCTTAPDWVRRQGLATLGLLGVYVCPAVFFDMAYSPPDHVLFFLFAGVTAGLRPWITPAGEPARATQAQPSKRVPGGVLLRPNPAI